MVAAAAIVVVVAVPAVGASASRPGLSWCSESSIDNLAVDVSQKPELGQIEVVVNSSYALDVVDKVWVRKQAPCEGITQPEVVILDGEAARLVLQDDDEISLYWRPPDTLPLFQEVQEFCITANRDSPEGPWNTFLAKFCFPNALLQTEKDVQSCSEMTCVRKCCPQGQAMAPGAMCAAEEEGDSWHPSLASGEPGAAATTIHMLYGPPRLCHNALVYHNFSILPSGMLKLQGELSTDVDGYCIDTFQGRPFQSVAMVCEEKVTAWHCDWKYLLLKPALLGVSCVFLLLTWLVYVSVAELRASNEGGCVISLVSSLLVTYATLIVLNLTAEDFAYFSCVVAGRLCHLSTLAAFFWMNVLSFHTFMQLRSRQDPAWERPLVFRLYSVYAWCCPLVLVLVGVVLDAVAADVIRPNIDTSCWFYDASAYWVYLYGPMLLLLLVNAVFFVGCIMLLCCGRGRHTYELSAVPQQTCGAWVCVRLVIIMGILWLMEVATWSFAAYCSIPEWIFDVVNSLQGVYIFLVTVCCRRNLKVFHCGCPRLVHRGKHREAGSPFGSGEASEVAANPLVPGS